MRITLARLEYKREVDRVRCLTGTFWVMFIDGQPAYRNPDRAKLLELL